MNAWRENFYEILGLPNFCSESDIKKRHRELAIRNHPDKGGDLTKMQKINSAYSDLVKNKMAYDSWLSEKLRPKKPEFVYSFHVQWGGSWSTATSTNSAYTS